mgnify:CR=1 FL=1
MFFFFKKKKKNFDVAKNALLVSSMGGPMCVNLRVPVVSWEFWVDWSKLISQTNATDGKVKEK